MIEIKLTHKPGTTYPFNYPVAFAVVQDGQEVQRYDSFSAALARANFERKKE